MWRKSILTCDRKGLSTAVTEWSRQGPTCLLVHGLGEAGCVWNHLAVRLAPSFRVVAVDLRGHGHSDWDPEAHYDGETFASDVERVVEAYASDAMVLVGHSIGAGVVMRLAARLGSRVAATVLVDFGPELDTAGVEQVFAGLAALPRSFPSPDACLDYLMQQRPLSDRAALKIFARSILRQASPHRWDVTSDPVLGQAGSIGAVGPEGTRVSDPGLWSTLARMHQPTLVVRGSGSGVFPPDVALRMVERTLPRGRLITIPRAGHAVMLDNPAAFSEQVLGFLSELRI